MAENCKVIKREVLYVQVQVTSPLSVSSGVMNGLTVMCSEMRTEIHLLQEILLQEPCVRILEKRRMTKIASWDLQEKMQMEMTMEK